MNPYVSLALYQSNAAEWGNDSYVIRAGWIEGTWITSWRYFIYILASLSIIILSLSTGSYTATAWSVQGITTNILHAGGASITDKSRKRRC